MGTSGEEASSRASTIAMLRDSGFSAPSIAELTARIREPIDLKPKPIDFHATNIVEPFRTRDLERLKQGPVINVFVGKRPHLELVMSHFPCALLSTFAPALAEPLAEVHNQSRHVVILDLDANAVSWCMRLAFAGFNLPEVAGRLLASFALPVTLHRLRVLLTLGQQSFVTRALARCVKEAALEHKIPLAHMAWIFADPAPKMVRKFADQLVDCLCTGVLNGRVKTPFPRGLDMPYFRRSVRQDLQVRRLQIEQKFFEDHSAFTQFQIGFIFAYTTAEDHIIRKAVARGMLWLIRQGYGSDLSEHVATRRKIPELNRLMKREDWIWQKLGCLHAFDKDDDPQLAHYQGHLDREEAFELGLHQENGPHADKPGYRTSWKSTTNPKAANMQKAHQDAALANDGTNSSDAAAKKANTWQATLPHRELEASALRQVQSQEQANPATLGNPGTQAQQSRETSVAARAGHSQKSQSIAPAPTVQDVPQEENRGSLTLVDASQPPHDDETSSPTTSDSQPPETCMPEVSAPQPQEGPELSMSLIAVPRPAPHAPHESPNLKMAYTINVELLPSAKKPLSRSNVAWTYHGTSDNVYFDGAPLEFIAVSQPPNSAAIEEAVQAPAGPDAGLATVETAPPGLAGEAPPRKGPLSRKDRRRKKTLKQQQNQEQGAAIEKLFAEQGWEGPHAGQANK